MRLFGLFTVLTTGVFCGDMGVPPAEASMRRIMSLVGSTGDPDVEWLMKQTDLLLIFVSNGYWQGPMEDRQQFIEVIERFVSATVLGPRGVDMREAANVFERYRLEYVSYSATTQDFGIDVGAARNRDLSRFALYLAQDLERHAPSLPSLLSDPEFPLNSDRRLLLASLTSIRSRLGSHVHMHDLTPYYLQHPIEYWQMLLEVYTGVEDRYNMLCQETGVDVAYVYYPMTLLRDLSWGFDIAGDQRKAPEILRMIDDPRRIEFAKKVGRCLDFALRHHSGDFVRARNQIAYRYTWDSRIDPEVICRQLMTTGFQQLDVHGPTQIPQNFPTPSIADGSFLPDLTDDRPPVPMEDVDAATIRVTRLVEVVALQVPEIRDVFQSIADTTSMSRIERILLSELEREYVRIERIAYDLAKWFGFRILALPMMRERYFNSLSEEQFEAFRRIISCMTHLERLVGDKYKALVYVTFALEHPDQIEFISRGLQALTRLYKKFQETPITDARYRTMTGFLPAYVVFGTPAAHGYFCSNFPLSLDADYQYAGSVHYEQFRRGLEWVIGSVSVFRSPADLVELVFRDEIHMADQMRIVFEFADERLHEFDAMSLSLDRILRGPQGATPIWFSSGWSLGDSLANFGLTLPRRIFAATVQLGGLRAMEAPMRTQLLRIVPVFVKLLTAIVNGELLYFPPASLHRIREILDDPNPTDAARLQENLDALENVIPQPTPAI